MYTVLFSVLKTCGEKLKYFHKTLQELFTTTVQLRQHKVGQIKLKDEFFFF